MKLYEKIKSCAKNVIKKLRGEESRRSLLMDQKQTDGQTAGRNSNLDW